MHHRREGRRAGQLAVPPIQLYLLGSKMARVNWARSTWSPLHLVAALSVITTVRAQVSLADLWNVPVPSIQTVSAAAGSSIGGQRLALVGGNFTTNFHEGHNKVFIGTDTLGWTECAVVEGACTVDCGSANRIVCDVLEVPDAWVAESVGGGAEHVDVPDLNVKVEVCAFECETPDPVMHTVTAGSSFHFQPARDSTTNPTLLGIEPRHLTTGGAVRLEGSKFGR